MEPEIEPDTVPTPPESPKAQGEDLNQLVGMFEPEKKRSSGGCSDRTRSLVCYIAIAVAVILLAFYGLGAFSSQEKPRTRVPGRNCCDQSANEPEGAHKAPEVTNEKESKATEASNFKKWFIVGSLVGVLAVGSYYLGWGGSGGSSTPTTEQPTREPVKPTTGRQQRPYAGPGTPEPYYGKPVRRTPTRTRRAPVYHRPRQPERPSGYASTAMGYASAGASAVGSAAATFGCCAAHAVRNWRWLFYGWLTCRVLSCCSRSKPERKVQVTVRERSSSDEAPKFRRRIGGPLFPSDPRRQRTSCCDRRHCDCSSDDGRVTRYELKPKVTTYLTPWGIIKKLSWVLVPVQPVRKLFVMIFRA